MNSPAAQSEQHQRGDRRQRVPNIVFWLACLLGISAAAGLAVHKSTSTDPPPAIEDFTLKTSVEVAPQPDRAEMRLEFFRSEVEPRITETDQLNREAADRCIARLQRQLDQYRNGIELFVDDLTSVKTRLGIVRRMPADWWKKDGRVETYVQQKFESHLFSEKELTEDVASILEAFRTDVDVNQVRMILGIRASLDSADLPEVEMGDYTGFLESVADRLQDYSSDQGVNSVQNAVTVLILSEAGGYAAVTVASGVIARVGAVAATTAATAGGATAGASAAGAGGGSLGGPVGTAVGLGVGLVIGLAIDWWMTERFEEELTTNMNRYFDGLELAILGPTEEHCAVNRPTGSETSQHARTLGLAVALPSLCDQLKSAYQTRFRQQIVEVETLP